MSVGAHDQHPSAAARRIALQDVSYPLFLCRKADFVIFDRQIVPCEMRLQIGNTVLRYLFLTDNCDNFDALCRAQQRHRIQHCAGGRTAVVPGHDEVFASDLNACLRKQQDRATGPEQDILGQLSLLAVIRV